MKHQFSISMALSLILSLFNQLCAADFTILNPISISRSVFTSAQNETVERWTRPPWSNTPVLRNVTQCTLTAYLPSQSKTNGGCVIVVPGGGFLFLSIKDEGEAVAKHLATQGIPTFVLKYRTLESTESDEAFQNRLERTLMRNENYSEVEYAEFCQAMKRQAPICVEETKQAVRFLREHASKYAINPNCIGMMGFSAGGYLTISTCLGESSAFQPDFGALIYAETLDFSPTDSNSDDRRIPFFMLYSSNDYFVGSEQMPFYQKLIELGYPVDLHVYADGNHGYGINQWGFHSDYWISTYIDWLKSIGILEE